MSRKKSQKVSDFHRNDVSPLPHGLRYRAACDGAIGNQIELTLRISYCWSYFCTRQITLTADSWRRCCSRSGSRSWDDVTSYGDVLFVSAVSGAPGIVVTVANEIL